jgi:hypothetical protein
VPWKSPKPVTGQRKQEASRSPYHLKAEDKVKLSLSLNLNLDLQLSYGSATM